MENEKKTFKEWISEHKVEICAVGVYALGVAVGVGCTCLVFHDPIYMGLSAPKHKSWITGPLNKPIPINELDEDVRNNIIKTLKITNPSNVVTTGMTMYFTEQK